MNDIQPYQFEPDESLQDKDDSDYFKENAMRIGSTNWCLCELCVLLVEVTSEHLIFLLPTFESGIRPAVMAALQ